MIIDEVSNVLSLILPYRSEVNDAVPGTVNWNDANFIPSPILGCGNENILAVSYKNFLVKFKLVCPKLYYGCSLFL